jgi:WD40 repeat protein
MATTNEEPTYGTKGGLIVPQPSTSRGEPTVIDVSPNGQHIIYCNSTNVIVRDIDDPTKCFVYGEHRATVRVAKFSPTGNYVASGDSEGNIRVWAWNHPENILKNEVS